MDDTSKRIRELYSELGRARAALHLIAEIARRVEHEHPEAYDCDGEFSIAGALFPLEWIIEARREYERRTPASSLASEIANIIAKHIDVKEGTTDGLPPHYDISGVTDAADEIARLFPPAAP